MPLLRGFILACLGFGAVHLGRAADLRVEGRATWAENINRASSAVDWRDTMRYEGRASASILKQWSSGLTTVSDIGLGYERVPEFSRQDGFNGGVTTTVRYKFGLGAYAPFVSTDLGLRGRDARIQEDDGWTASAALRVGKRLTESWRFSAIGDWQQHYARSDVFDTKHHRVYATVTWNIRRWLHLTTGNGRLWGSFTANAGPVVWPRALAGLLGKNIGDYYNTIPWTVTDSYGPGWVTYIVDGRVSFWWLELTPALGPNTSLPLRYESLFSVNKVGVKYRQDVWTLQILHRF